MAKLTLDDLKKLREQKLAEMNQRNLEGKEVHIIVGMGTCGIAAGAKQAFDAFIEELDREGLRNVSVRQTGCMGLCHSEPTVQVLVPGMPTVIYGRVDPDTARKIVSQHIGRRLLVSDHIFDKPAPDIIQK